jgi:uncharacterized membrane protein YbhN (UPF0104 family)
VLLFMLVNVVTAGAVAGLTLPLALPADGQLGSWRWAFLLLVVGLAALHPAVLNRLVAAGSRLLRRSAPETALSLPGVAAAVGWTVLEWVAAGVMLAALLSGFRDPVSLPLAVGAFALAWAVGFVVVVVPAGAGVREGVLLVLLSGSVGHSTALAAALGTRLLMTLADGGWALALVPHVVRTRLTRATPPATAPAPVSSPDPEVTPR